MKLVQLGLLLPLVGCGAGIAVDRAEERRAHLHAKVAEDLRYEACDGAAFGSNCGLLVEHASTDSFRTAFREKECRDLDTAACQDRFDRTLGKALAARYFSADIDGVKAQCERDACDPLLFERQLLASHDANLLARAERAERNIDRDIATAKQRASNAAAAAFVGLVLLDTAAAATNAATCNCR